MLSRLQFIGGALAASVVLCSIGSAQTTIFSDDFENGTAQWSMTGLWHPLRNTSDCAAAALPFPSGNHCMWYGIDGQCNFQNGAANSGSLRMVSPVAIPNAGQAAVLRYSNQRHAELCGCVAGGYDWTKVHVSVNGGASWLVVREECELQFPWRKGRVDLTPYVGMNVLVRFELDTFDDVFNSTLGWLLDDVSIQLEPGRSYCETQSCPCFVWPARCPDPYNVGGCKHSTSTTSGAELAGAGTPSVANDDVVLKIEGMPATSFVTFLQGNVLASGIAFGDGVRCIGGSLLRLGTKPVLQGVAFHPGPLDPPLSLQGMIPFGGGITVGYQGHYRDGGSFCTEANFNTTNGYQVAWMP